MPGLLDRIPSDSDYNIGSVMYHRRACCQGACIDERVRSTRYGRYAWWNRWTGSAWARQVVYQIQPRSFHRTMSETIKDPLHCRVSLQLTFSTSICLIFHHGYLSPPTTPKNAWRSCRKRHQDLGGERPLVPLQPVRYMGSQRSRCWYLGVHLWS